MSNNRVEARKSLADAAGSMAPRETVGDLRATVGTGYALLALADAVEHVAEVAEASMVQRHRDAQDKLEQASRFRVQDRQAETDRAARERFEAAERHAERMRARARRWRWVPKALRPAEVRRWSA